ncbi:MAG TPA: hypothetical protein DEP48_01950 [Persephonella sp.]|uniref:Putative lipoprotein n=1 Tax=Persephonella marina (strain DSM 14350 / EX-H1) TaxID=123214 RepID=C0QRQ9_PERMH|nr:hypothetical protein [Persephonella marina]ACO04453.1 putative lipoprotein [Persephonella marina EX-H1]HCB69100.1 hypothetical protein [Persephonella sp.]
MLNVRVFLFFLIISILSCSLDYSSMDVEELEILYKKENKNEVLPYLCRKYYKKYQKELINKDYILNKTQEYMDKTVNYCALSFKKLNDIGSAKILEELYFSNYVNTKKDFLYFIYWAYKAGDKDTLDTFIKKDSVIFAVLFHSDRLMNYLVKDINYISDREVINRFKTAYRLLVEYQKDIKDLDNSWLFYTDKEYISRSFSELTIGFDQLIRDMKSNRFLISEIRDNLSKYEKAYFSSRTAKKYVELFYTLKALMRINLDNFYIFTLKKEDINRGIARAMNVKEKDTDILQEVLPVIKEFVEEKDKYIKKYDEILKKES